MLFIKIIFSHKYQNKEELDNCIFESNVFNNNRFSNNIGLMHIFHAICKCTHQTWNEK